MLDQIAREPGGTGGAVAFADHKERRGPALIAAEVETDEFADGFDIAAQAEEFARLVALNGAAVAGAHGIDEDQIGLVEPGVFIVDQLIRRRRHHAVRLHAYALGSDGAEVQPHGSRAGAAVEREGKRTVLGGLAVQRVGDVEDVRLDLAGVDVFERHHAGRRRVVESLAADLHFVVRNHRRLLRNLLLWFGRRRWSRPGPWLIGGGGSGPLTALSLLRKCSERSQKQKDGQK